VMHAAAQVDEVDAAFGVEREGDGVLEHGLGSDELDFEAALDFKGLELVLGRECAGGGDGKFDGGVFGAGVFEIFGGGAQDCKERGCDKSENQRGSCHSCLVSQHGTVLRVCCLGG